MKVATFIKKSIALMNGDTDKAIATENADLATSAIEVQLATKRGERTRSKSRIKQLEKAMDTAKYPTKLIENDQAYVDGIIASSVRLTDEQEELEVIERTIALLESTLAGFE